MEERTTRRQSLVQLGGLLAGALGVAGWRASESAGAGPAGVASGTIACVLSPELTEGPYYIAGEQVRRDITEGHRGAPLALRLTVLDARTCRPIKGAAVDIWHADAAGRYSGFDNGVGSRTFMRGIQRTDANGLALFKTVYPGWYHGRAVHIHVKVHLGGSVVHTGQLFFSDTLTDAVYERAPYRSRGPRDVRNADDSIFVNGGRLSMLAVRESGAGYSGRIAMGVHR